VRGFADFFRFRQKSERKAAEVGGNWGLVAGFGYSYVADGNNIYRKTFDHRARDPYNAYTYDDLDHLTDVTYHDSDTEAFVMDALGNRTGDQTLREDGAVNFTVDSATNRYTAIGGNSISHDEAGNLTVDKEGYQYPYDYENRVVKIEDSSSSRRTMGSDPFTYSRVTVRVEIASLAMTMWAYRVFMGRFLSRAFRGRQVGGAQ